MKPEEKQMVALSDREGNFYLVEREAILQGRVSPARQAELERVLGTDEVSGYAVWPDAMIEATSQGDDTFSIAGSVTVTRMVE